MQNVVVEDDEEHGRNLVRSAASVGQSPWFGRIELANLGSPSKGRVILAVEEEVDAG